MADKFILDACCGGRMLWFVKEHKNTIYIDYEIKKRGHIKQRPNHEVKPNILMDFRELGFKDKSFKLVIWDPPHRTKMQETSIFGRKYGSLNAETWQSDLKTGFKECWRVLENYGILIFKWSDVGNKIKNILGLFDRAPLFGHTTGSNAKTHWLCFMKIPKNVRS